MIDYKESHYQIFYILRTRANDSERYDVLESQLNQG